MRLLCYLLYGVLFGDLIVPSPALAQIEIDGTTPTNLRNCHSTCTIEGGTRANRNLFHSFREFNIRNNQQVYFNHPGNIENIFSRVTGNNPSRISGLLGVNGSANLFLLNSNGILFSSNATLDVRGSFIATTAESVVFNNGIEFATINPQTPSPLTISTPLGLQFGPNSGKIINRSQARLNNQTNAAPVGLQVQPNRTLALVGGRVSLEGGNLTAIGNQSDDGTIKPSGRIEIGSVVGTGLVELQVVPFGFAFDYSSIQNFGNIKLFSSVIDTSGESGGGIQLQGGNIFLRDSAIVSSTLGDRQGDNLLLSASQSLILNDGSLVATSTEGGGAAGNIYIEADSMELVSSDLGSQSCLLQNCGDVTGSSGNLVIRSRQLILQAGARIDASTLGTGATGNINIRATHIEIAGSLLDEKGQPIIENGQPITSGIFTQVGEGVAFNTGNAGNLEIRTSRLIVREGGQISTATFGRGRGGDLSIEASDSITLNGIALGGTENVGRSGLFVSSEPSANVNAGELTVTTPRLTVESGSEISARNRGTGSGGVIILNVNQLIVQNTGRISSSSVSQGSGGILDIRANSILLNRGTLSTEATAGSGAEIQIRNIDVLTMQNSSQISARASNNAAGGNVLINASNGFVVAPNAQNSDIIASAEFGRGGRIAIEAQGILGFEERRSSPENITNDIDASSQFGRAGTVVINSPIIDPNTVFPSLPTAPVNTELAQGCQVEGGVASAAFFSSGRGGIPITPYEPLSSNPVLDDVRLPESDHPIAHSTDSSKQDIQSSDRLVEAKGWIVNQKGQVELVAEVPDSQRGVGCSLR